ncbi:MAG TPA: 50S ribosomal protein L15 [Candidatus Limnocylindrales bacterium]|nr:50S ribosomal protein L15 [Candidatus Limnocylindrales bacterium]
MKLHDLRPAPGSHKKKTRVGRGIAAGQGKTAGRGTKGQKARAGGSIPAWFEGGQTPLHQRIPKLRGFKNPFKIDYEVVNVGAIARLVELGVLEDGEMPGTKKAKAASPAPITVNQEILRAAGLVRTLNKPMKVLGNGELSTALFVVADAVSGSARAKIEAAGGTVSLLEVPKSPLAALGVVPEAVEDVDAPAPAPEAPAPAPTTEKPKRSRARAGSPAPADEPADAAADAPEAIAEAPLAGDAPAAVAEPVDAPAEPVEADAASDADADDQADA